MIKVFSCIALVLSGVSSAVAATNGAVNFTGLVAEPTCHVTITNDTVELPEVSISTLLNAGDIAGTTLFVIRVDSCSVDVMARPFFTQTNVDEDTGYTTNRVSEGAGGSTNIEARILNNDFEPIDLRVQDNNPYMEVVDGEGLFKYNAQYISVDDNPTKGTFRANMEFTLEYD